MDRFPNFTPIIALPLILLFLSGCYDPINPFAPPDFTGVEIADTTAEGVQKVTMGELTYYLIEEGEGPWSIQGRADERLRLFLTLKIKGGEILQSTYANGNTFSEDVSMEAFFEPAGLFEGVVGMKEGERRVLVVPPELGFADVDANSQFFNFRDETLIYDVELVRILSSGN